MAAKVTKARVNYRYAGLLARKKCGTCSMFIPAGEEMRSSDPLQPSPAACTLVRGPIRRRDVCDRWYPAR